MKRALLLIICLASSLMAQDVSPELMREAMSKTGLTESELLGKLDAKETLEQTEPGRAEPLSPVVVLPGASLLEEAFVPPIVEAAPETLSINYFGADFFKGDPGLFNPSSFGPVPGEYLIGSGDQIVVDVWGEVEFRHERIVDRDGSIILPRAGRISCVNVTLDQVTRDIRNKLRNNICFCQPWCIARYQGFCGWRSCDAGRL